MSNTDCPSVPPPDPSQPVAVSLFSVSLFLFWKLLICFD